MLPLSMRMLKRNLTLHFLIHKALAYTRALKHCAHRLLRETVVSDSMLGSMPGLGLVRDKVQDEERAAGNKALSDACRGKGWVVKVVEACADARDGEIVKFRAAEIGRGGDGEEVAYMREAFFGRDVLQQM